VDIGFSPGIEQYDPQLAHSLKYNVAQFSAFKESSFKSQLEQLLTSNGDIVPWSDFKKKAYAISGDYNKRWLKTEYDHTVASANMAAKWKDWEENVDLYPNLKYVTVGDQRVRAKHAQWDGLILPFNHPWWQTHLPPNEFGCRCDAEQTDEDVSVELPSTRVNKEFENNPASTGKVFKENAYEKSMTATDIIAANKRMDDFLAGKRDTIPTRNPKLNIEIGADDNDLARNLDVGEVVSKDLDHEVLIRQHVEVRGTKNPEYLFDNTYLGERKSIKTSNGVLYGLDKAKDQMMHASVNPDALAYYVVFDLDEMEVIDWVSIQHNISRKITTSRGTKVKAIIISINNQAVELTREDIIARDYSKLDALKKPAN
jgi:SPP1 gp7 family putative phage head morphogenesis protein